MAVGGRDLQMRELMDTMKELKLTIEALRKELTTKDTKATIICLE